MRQNSPFRLPVESGIALGPILFVLAILGILSAVISAGSGSFGAAGIIDRVSADIPSQANLIRAKINECNMMYGTNSNGDGYPNSGGVSIAISTVTCTGDPTGLQNIWTGNRTANLPPPSLGFGSWYYINTNNSGLGGTAAGGRCIWIKPTTVTPGIKAGLTRAATKFTSSASNNAAAEVNYNPASTNQRFVVWISAPPAAGSESAECNSNL